MQGTFLVAIEAHASWDPARPLLPWLLGLLANRVRESRRREAREPVVERVTMAAGERDPAELAAHGEFGVAFSSALQRIEEPFRTALERHLVHGHAAHEIAAELGVPAGTVRMRLHRGLDQLRQKLPQGFVVGGAVVLQVPPEAFAAMRQVVLAKVPGGAAVAVVGPGHLAVVGVILMKKTMLAVVGCLLLGFGLWSLWPEVGGASEIAPKAVVAVITKPMAVNVPAAESAIGEAPGTERRAVKSLPPKPPEGQLRLVLRHGGTGAPVRQVSLEVHAGSPGEPVLRGNGQPPMFPAGDRSVQFGKSDEGGAALFTLPVGTAFVVTSTLRLEPPPRIEIIQGMLTELTIDFPVRLAAVVEVVDAQGQPLAGARILGRTYGDVGYYVERELGRTEADGCWREQFLDAAIPVRATCAGQVASAQVHLHGKAPRTRFVLENGPAVVAGTVFGSDGRPLAGALVAIQQRVPGVAGDAPLALVADAQGHYESTHVRPGAITVFASQPPPRGMFQTARAFRTARTDTVVEVGGPQQVDVRFGAGARLIVALTGPDGRPVADHEVNASWLPEREVDVHLSSMARAYGLTDANGICTLDALMPGNYEVQTFGATWRKQEKIALVEGQEQRLVWSFAPAVDIEVQVVDELQQPLADWYVGLSPGVGTVRTEPTDREGVVRFAQVADEPYVVSVRQREGVPESVRTKVSHGARNVVVVGKAALATGGIRGAVRVPAGMALADVRAELSLFEQRGAGRMQQAPRDPEATFSFDGLPAGVYELAFRSESDREYLRMPQRIDVAAAATVDVGTVELRAAAAVRIDVACADGAPVRELFTGIATVDPPRFFGTPPTTVDARGVTLLSIPAGRFEVVVWGADIAPVFVPVVVAGAPVQLAVTTQRAVATTFRFVGLPAGRPEAVVTYQQQGAELLSEQHRGGAWVRGFLPGRYRIEIATPDGQRGAVDFVVGTTSGEVVEVRVTK